MTASHLQFKIEKAQHTNLLMAIYSILGFIAAFVGAAFLPEILVRYIIKAQSMEQVPAYLEYLPVVFISIAFLFFVFAIFSSIARAMQMKRWEKELDNLVAVCCMNCGGNCECVDHTNCQCGCNTMTTESSEPTVISAEPVVTGTSADMAARMKSLNTKKSAKRKKVSR